MKGAQVTSTAFLGIDAGSSGCKVTAVDQDGRVAASTRIPYAIVRGPDGSAVADATTWTRGVAAATAECLSHVQIEALSITAPAHYVVLLDEDDLPLAPMMIASDTRPTAIAAELLAEHGDAAFASTWARLSPGWSHAQLAWLNRTHPDLMSRVRTVLPFKDYLRFQITGDRGTDPSDAAGTGLWSQRDAAWDHTLLHDCGLPPSTLPVVRPALTVVHATPAARRWGITPGTPVAVGATDTAAELCSAASDAGAQLVKLATTGTVVSSTDKPQPTPEILTYPHVEEGLWYHLGVINTAASILHYAADTFANGANDIPRLLAEAAATPPGADDLLFLPFLDGERTPYWNSGMRGALLGLTARHGRGHIVRAALEGVALAMAVNADLLERLGLWRRSSAWFSGGGAASPLWGEILAAALHQELTVNPAVGPAFGAALIAGRALGASPPPVPSGHTVTPDSELVDRYLEMKAPYEAAVQATEALRRSSTPGTRP